jgi:hypothetical protein
MLFALYAGRAGTPIVTFSPGWIEMPLIGGGMTWAMAWHQYAIGDVAPIIKATATHMTWATMLAYRGVGYDMKTGLPYEGLIMDNPEGGATPVAAGVHSLRFPMITPQGAGRLLVKLGIAWVHDHTAQPTAQLTIRDAMTERGPLAQQYAIAPSGDQLLRFSSLMDMPGTWGVTASGNSVDTTMGNIAVKIAAMAFALLPAS